jgi:hypothetical protein
LPRCRSSAPADTDSARPAAVRAAMTTSASPSRRRRFNDRRKGYDYLSVRRPSRAG